MGVPSSGHFLDMSAWAGPNATSVEDVRFGSFMIEVRWSALALLSAYAVAGLLTAVAGGHLATGRVAANAATFAALAFLAAIAHEVGHLVVGLLYGRRPLRLVLKAGAAIQIEEAPPGSRGGSAPAECLVALGGPLVSLLVALTCFGVSTSPSTPYAWVGLLTLIDGLLNLVPLAARSDGDRIVQALLHHH